MSKVTSMGSYQALAAAEERVDEFSQEQLQLSRDEARLQRLVKTCEAVALAANLPRIAPPDIVERYQQLVAMEESTLAASAVSQSAELAGQGVDK